MPAGMRPWQAAVPASPHLRAGTLCVRRAGKQDLCTRRASRARYALTGVGPESGKTAVLPLTPATRPSAGPVPEEFYSRQVFAHFPEKFKFLALIRSRLIVASRAGCDLNKISSHGEGVASCRAYAD